MATNGHETWCNMNGQATTCNHRCHLWLGFLFVVVATTEAYSQKPNSVRVTTDVDLQQVLGHASPGDIITLAGLGWRNIRIGLDGTGC